MIQVEQKDLKAILDINQKINSLTDVKSILEDISAYAGSLLGAEGASILLVDRQTGDLHFEVAFGENAESLYNLTVPKGKGIAGTVALTGKHIIVNDTQRDERFYKGIDAKTNLTTRSLLAVPLIHGENIVGVLEVINASDAGGFSTDHVSIITQFAEQAAIAISNALLYRELQDKANELEYLFQISNLTNMTREKKRLFDQIVQLLSNAFSSERVSIMFVDEEHGTLFIESAMGIPDEVISKVAIRLSEDRISSAVASSGKPIFSNDISDTGFGRNKALRYRKAAFISVPIKSKNIPIGVLNISEPKAGVYYNAAMLKTLQTIANQVANAYESNRSYLEHIEHEKIKKELDIMRMLQQALLISNFKDYPHISVFATMIPAKIVGGDFYDLFELAQNKLAFVIGDVSGKSLPASLFMAISRSVVKAYSFQIEEPHKLLEAANLIMVDDSRVGMFVTMFYGVIDLETGIVRYSNAGHNLQFLYRIRSGEFVPLTSRGIPLGISGEEYYETNEVNMESGDIVICFTDGVLEAVNEEGEEFGMQRIKAVIEEYASGNSSTLVKALTREVNAWANNVPQWDDMTVLAIKIA